MLGDFIKPSTPQYEDLMTTPQLEERFAASIHLPTIASLPQKHIAKQFLLQRKIDKIEFEDLYYAIDFKDFIKEIVPEKFNALAPSEKRIVIPWWDENKKLLGFQGRAIGKAEVRYISVKLKESNRKIFGLNRINRKEIIRVVEGPFDSMFLHNCVASMDSALYSVIPMVGSECKFLFIYDNEPHNINVIRSMERTISMGQPIVIWPNNIEQKDINDMVIGGLAPEEIIKTRTFDGLRATLELNVWRKV